MIAISTASCATVEQRLTAAAVTRGTIAAGIDMPDQPDDCRRQEAHADLKAGTEAKTILIRERAALDRQNARTGRCADFYDDVKAKLGGDA